MFLGGMHVYLKTTRSMCAKKKNIRKNFPRLLLLFWQISHSQRTRSKKNKVASQLQMMTHQRLILVYKSLQRKQQTRRFCSLSSLKRDKHTHKHANTHTDQVVEKHKLNRNVVKRKLRKRETATNYKNKQKMRLFKFLDTHTHIHTYSNGYH